ncbi:MAG: hypothetical protein K0R80_2201 [Clostridia bacterium]|nr:hypothetical protein [Clostridia bacterium]
MDLAHFSIEISIIVIFIAGSTPLRFSSQKKHRLVNIFGNCEVF